MDTPLRSGGGALGTRNRDPAALLEAARGGDRLSIGRLLSLVERGGPAAREVGRLTFASGSEPGQVIGITGAPGAGKSTLTDRLITLARQGASRVGVLAVDPSSPFSGGAILGDRIRMQGHALDEGVFIRSMATRGHLGGLALAAPEAIRLHDAVGREQIIGETVGVGQVEVEVAAKADTTVVVVNPGWGDAVQANKAGLMEIADVFVINKADRPGVDQTRRDLEQMLDLSELGDWRPPIVATVGSTGQGVEALWQAVLDHRRASEASGVLEGRRQRRLHEELRGILVSRLDARARQLCSGDRYDQLVAAVVARQVDPWSAADELLEGVGA